MPNDIDSISIQLKASSIVAKDAIDRLIKSFGDLSNAVGAVSGAIMKFNKDLNEIATRNYGKTFEDLGNGMTATAQGMGQIAVNAMEMNAAFKDIDGKQIGETSSKIARLNTRVTNAAENMKTLAENAKTFNDTVGESAKKTQGLADSLEKVKKTKIKVSMKEAAKETEGFSKKTEKASGMLAKLGRSILRIGFYRLVRSAFKLITDSLKEGVNALYEWSSMANGTFSQSMDTIKTSVTYLQRSLGTLVQPLLERVAPVIDWIVDKAVAAINYINKSISAITGKPWTEATKQTQKYAESTDKATKSLQRFLRSFDELEVMSSNSNSTSASTGSVDSTSFIEHEAETTGTKLSGIVERLAPLWESFVGTFDAVKDSIIRIIEKIQENFEKFAGNEAVQNFIGGIEDLLDSLTEFFNSKTWKSIEDVFAVVITDAVVTTLNSFGTALEFISGIVQLLSGNSDGFTTMKEAFKDFVSQNVIDRFGKLLDKFEELGTFEKILASILNPIGYGIPALITALFDPPEGATWLETIRDIAKDAYEWIQKLVDALGIKFFGGLFDKESSNASATYTPGDVPEITAKNSSSEDESTGIIGKWFKTTNKFWSTMANNSWEGQVYNLIKNKLAYNKGSAYATGGFPDVGEMFIARESGPEMVGTIGGRNAVATNGDIVNAVSKGVYEAVASAMGGGNGNTQINVTLDGKTVYQSVVNRNRREIIRTGANPLMA